MPPIITDEPDETPPQAPAPKAIVFLSVEEAMAHAKARALANQVLQPEIIPNPTPSPPVTLTGDAPVNQSAEVQFTNVGQQLPMGVLGIAGAAQATAASPLMYKGVEIHFDHVDPKPAPKPLTFIDEPFAGESPPNPPQTAADPAETLPSEQADSAAPPPAVEGTPQSPVGLKFPDDMAASELLK